MCNCFAEAVICDVQLLRRGKSAVKIEMEEAVNRSEESATHAFNQLDVGRSSTAQLYSGECVVLR